MYRKSSREQEARSSLLAVIFIIIIIKYILKTNFFKFQLPLKVYINFHRHLQA